MDQRRLEIVLKARSEGVQVFKAAKEAVNELGPAAEGITGKFRVFALTVRNYVRDYLISGINSFKNALGVVETNLHRFGTVAGGIFRSITQVLGNLIAQVLALAGALASIAFLRRAVDEYAAYDSLKRGLTAVMNSAELATSEMSRLRDVAKLPGLGFKEALQGSINLQSAGMSAELARRSMMAFGNALATVGKGKADLAGVQLALGQIMTKGKVQGDELIQLAERVPQIRQIMLKAFGTASPEDLSKLRIDAKTFVTAIVSELEKLPKMSGGIQNTMENMGDTLSLGMAKIGEKVAPSFTAIYDWISANLNTWVEKVAGYVDKASKWFLKNKDVFIAWGEALVEAFGDVVTGANEFLNAALGLKPTMEGTVGLVGSLVNGLRSLAAWWREHAETIGKVVRIAAGLYIFAQVAIFVYNLIKGVAFLITIWKIWATIAPIVVPVLQQIGGGIGMVIQKLMNLGITSMVVKSLVSTALVGIAAAVVGLIATFAVMNSITNAVNQAFADQADAIDTTRKAVEQLDTANRAHAQQQMDEAKRKYTYAQNSMNSTKEELDKKLNTGLPDLLTGRKMSVKQAMQIIPQYVNETTGEYNYSKLSDRSALEKARLALYMGPTATAEQRQAAAILGGLKEGTGAENIQDLIKDQKRKEKKLADARELYQSYKAGIGDMDKEASDPYKAQMLNTQAAEAQVEHFKKLATVMKDQYGEASVEYVKALGDQKVAMEALLAEQRKARDMEKSKGISANKADLIKLQQAAEETWAALKKLNLELERQQPRAYLKRAQDLESIAGAKFDYAKEYGTPQEQAKAGRYDYEQLNKELSIIQAQMAKVKQGSQEWFFYAKALEDVKKQAADVRRYIADIPMNQAKNALQDAQGNQGFLKEYGTDAAYRKSFDSVSSSAKELLRIQQEAFKVEPTGTKRWWDLQAAILATRTVIEKAKKDLMAYDMSVTDTAIKEARSKLDYIKEIANGQNVGSIKAATMDVIRAEKDKLEILNKQLEMYEKMGRAIDASNTRAEINSVRTEILKLQKSMRENLETEFNKMAAAIINAPANLTNILAKSGITMWQKQLDAMRKRISAPDAEMGAGVNPRAAVANAVNTAPQFTIYANIGGKEIEAEIERVSEKTVDKRLRFSAT